MTINLIDPEEPKLNLSQAARYFAPSRGDRPAHKSRIVRYITDGVKGPSGARVFLGALRQGNQWVTTPSAIRKNAERAGRELAKRGI